MAVATRDRAAAISDVDSSRGFEVSSQQARSLISDLDKYALIAGQLAVYRAITEPIIQKTESADKVDLHAATVSP